MGIYDVAQSVSTNLKGIVQAFKVNSKTPDEATLNETYWDNNDFPKYFGYYKQIPELKKAIDALAQWTTGKGYTCDVRTKVSLEHITGWGEDTFESIIQNMIIIKKVNGDAYAEIIRDEESGTLLNLKVLNPSNVRVVVDSKGLIKHYEEFDPASKTTRRKIPKKSMFHLSNDRVANEIHGTSVIDACKWVIDARNEAMSDWRRILHRSTIRVLEVDTDNSTQISTLRTQYAEAIKNGEVLIIPKGNAQFADLSPPNAANFLDWIRYLENFFYQAVGIPKIILGGSQEFTEASSKIGYLTFEQVYASEQRLLEQDIWNQLYLRVTFYRPVSLKEDIVESEAANTGQIGVQPNNVNVGVSRNE